MALWIAVAVAAVLVIGGGVTAATMLNSSQPLPPAERVTLEPVGTPGTDPFLASVSITEVTAFPDSVQAVASANAASLSTDAATGTLTVSGTADNLFGGRQAAAGELYGGSGELADCDVQVLAEFLAANPEKARAWADVRDIDPAQISEYLKTLTPVVLLHDTLVTNHGFSNGVAVPYQAVLQAGTGVLVDWTGQPVVRCACGNPLSAPKAANLSSAELLGTRWDGYDPSRTVVVSGGPVTDGFVLVDMMTGESYTRPVGFDAPVPTTPPTPTPTAPPVAATSGPECAFDLTDFDRGIFGNRAWVEAQPPGSLTCAAMIAQYRKYQDWTGPSNGMVAWVDLGDGWTCDSSWVPLTMPEYIDGSVGRCSTGPDGARSAGSDTVSSFTVWYGEYGEHKVPQTAVAAAPPAPEATIPAPDSQPSGCARGGSDFRNGGFGEYTRDLSCQEMLGQWDAFLADTSMLAEPVGGWRCFPPSAGDYGGCFNKDLGVNFSVHPASGVSPDADPGSGGSEPVAVDLGLSVPVTKPACDGMGIVVLFSATTPGLYETEVQQMLNDHPGSSYLRTDQTCSSLNQSYEGNPIYTVYQAAGYDLGGLCQAASSLGGYARWLNNTSAPNTDPCS